MIRTAIALLTFAALAAGTAAQAQTVYPSTGTAAGAGNITAHKQKELAKIQEKMQVLQTLQSCVTSASTTQAIQQCNETARASRGTQAKKC